MKKSFLTLSILLFLPFLSLADDIKSIVNVDTLNVNVCMVIGVSLQSHYNYQDYTLTTYCSGATVVTNDNSKTALYGCNELGKDMSFLNYDDSVVVFQNDNCPIPDGTTTEETTLEDGTNVETEQTHLDGVLVSEVVTSTSPDGTVTVQSTTNNSDGSLLQEKEKITTSEGFKETIKDYTEEGWDYYQLEEDTVDGVTTGTTRSKSCTESVEFGTTCTEVDENIYQMYEETYESEIQHDEQTNVTIQTETTTNPKTGVTEIITTETNNNTGEVQQTKNIVDNETPEESSGGAISVDIDMTETNEILQGISDKQEAFTEVTNGTSGVGGLNLESPDGIKTVITSKLEYGEGDTFQSIFESHYTTWQQEEIFEFVNHLSVSLPSELPTFNLNLPRFNLDASIDFNEFEYVFLFVKSLVLIGAFVYSYQIVFRG